jgi:two-component system CheB/CheR fusion protein
MTVAAADGASEDDRWMQRGDGSRFWASGVLLALRDEDRNVLGYGKLLRNRTDLKEQIETLRNRMLALEESSRSRNAFLAMLSHELRNPLAAIGTAATVLRIQGEKSGTDPIAVIERQVAMVRRLLDDMTELSGLKAGKLRLALREVALHEVVERAVESTAAAVKEKAQRLRILLPPSPVYLQADPDRLEQVFVNLIVNATKYTPRRGQIWVKATTDGHEAVVQVEDNGIGIAPDLQPRVFELFTQAPGARPPSSGMGIGLAVVKELVALHGGSVQVRSNGIGKGSEFSVRLPLRPRAAPGETPLM